MTNQMLPLAAAAGPRPLWLPCRTTPCPQIEARQRRAWGTRWPVRRNAKSAAPHCSPFTDAGQWRTRDRHRIVLDAQTNRSPSGDASTGVGNAAELDPDIIVLDTLGDPIPVGVAEVTVIETYLGDMINDVLARSDRVMGTSSPPINRSETALPCSVRTEE